MGDYLTRFVKEVVQKDIKGLLPQNLSDEWLDVLSGEAHEYISKMNNESLPSEEEASTSALFIAVVAILNHQHGNKGSFEIAPEELMRCIQNYIVALSTEEISRKTDVKVEPPTLKNIFRDDRRVKVHYTEALKNQKAD